ncbi:MAG TPA: type II secretion system protein M [Steroidobacteraceae bacterium]|jgi:general secretion pathway protein M|nr:type II secretion system protein M [Steroidobacteraceae bacterium]
MRIDLANMNERERRMVLFGGIAAVVLLIFGIVLPLESSVSKAQARVEKKQADLQWMRAVGPELASAGPAVARPTSNESLLVIVDRAARESGLGNALVNSEPSGQNGLRVRLEKAPFGLIVGWLARLADQHGIRVESATMDNAGEPGVVNAGLVLRTQ